MKSIDPLLFISAIIVNFVAVRLGSYFLPDRLYFSFSAFLFETRDLDKPLAIAAKLFLPFAVSFGLCVLLFWVRKIQTGLTSEPLWAVRVVEEQAVITLSFAAAFLALLMAWPYIILWDVLIAPELQVYRLVFLLAYAAYIFAVGSFAMAGANMAMAVMSRDPSSEPFTLETILQWKFTRSVFDAASGSVSAALAVFLASQGGLQ